ncbi:MAG: hypothetical protein ABEL76_12015, partial [Bradymonadaceae bacterium]
TGVVVLRSGGERGRLRELSGKDALAAVLDQMYDFEESPRSWRRRRFRDARRLAERIPIHEVWRGPDGEGGDPTDLIPDV